jgi:DNA polymerase III delta prime subunit
MQELAPERQALKAALDALKVDAWVFEQDAGARPESIQKAFLEELEAADLYIGLFWKGYGEYTIEEYDHARKRGKDCLIYEKRDALNGQRDPRLQVFLDRLGNVETGLTVKSFDDALQLGEAVKDDVAKWQARTIRGRRASRINVNLSLTEKKERDELLVLLRKVKEFWVEGVLEKSLHGQALIDLGKEEWNEKTTHPWEQILELPDQTSRALRPGEPIDKIFAELERSLLILGAPGSGKTITLLVLARELIVRAENDPAQPIPVVFNLSSWRDPKQDLVHWLIDELLAKYQIPKKIARRWLEANWIVPLLDGLDEVMTANQPACVEAINTYVQDNGVPGLAVCSRLNEYTDVPVRLHIAGAICLQPLRPEDVTDYVARSGGALAGLKAALDKDRVLQTLAKTPLMLDAMSLAYPNLSMEELTGVGLNSEKERRKHLFDTYIDKMLIRKGKGTQKFARELTLGWLHWLARCMQQQGQTVFLIEQIQPSWLTTRGQRLLYMLSSRMLFGLIFGLISGLGDIGLRLGVSSRPFSGLAIGLIDERRLTTNKGRLWATIEEADHRWQTVIIVIIFSLSVGLICGLSIGPIYGLTSGLIFGLFWGLRSRNRRLASDIQSVEILRWSRVDARKGYRFGLKVGLIAGLIFGFLFELISGLRLSELIFSLVSGLTTFGLFGGLIGGLFGGLKGGIVDTKATPNLGIRLSMRNALLGGGLALLVFGLLSGLFFVPTSGLSFALTSAPTFGLICGVIAFFWYGGQDVIQHYILRFIFYWKGHMPLCYATFLDYATRVVFLQKVGGGYIFIHRLLLEHFAAKQSGKK